MNLTKEIIHFQKTFWTIFYWLHSSYFAIWKLITLNLHWVCVIAMKFIFVISMYFIVLSIIFENWIEKDSLNKIGVQYGYTLTWNDLNKNSLKKKKNQKLLQRHMELHTIKCDFRMVFTKLWLEKSVENNIYKQSENWAKRLVYTF